MSPSLLEAKRSLGRDVMAYGRTAIARLKRRPRATVLVERTRVLAAGGTDELVASYPSFDAWCAVAGECRAALAISGYLLHSLTLDAADRDLSLHEQATRRFAHYHGRASSEWPVAVAVSSGHVYASALHGFDLDRARGLASDGRIELEAVTPLWARALAAAMSRSPDLRGAQAATLVLTEGMLATCMDCRGGVLVSLQQRYLEEATAEALADLLSRRDAEAAAASPLTFVTGWGLRPLGVGEPWLRLGRTDGDASTEAWLYAP